MNNIKGEMVTPNIYLCPDNKYRWAYELNMLKNPVILFTVLKIFGIVFLVITAFQFLLAVFDGDGYLFTPQFLIIPGIFIGLSLLGYFILACLYGFKYMVLFEMDDEGITHRQMPGQFKKAEAMGWLTAAAGIVTGNMSAAGAGLLASCKESSHSGFDNVKKVVNKRHFDAIMVNETIERNQVYAGKEDFDFVWQYITSRCIKAKIVK